MTIVNRPRLSYKEQQEKIKEEKAVEERAIRMVTKSRLMLDILKELIDLESQPMVNYFFDDIRKAWENTDNSMSDQVLFMAMDVIYEIEGKVELHDGTIITKAERTE